MPETVESDVPKKTSWFDRCLYKCGKCDYESYARSTVTAHGARCPWLFRTGGKADTVMLTRRLFRCAECGDATLHERSRIESHLKYRHGGMKLFDYAAKHRPHNGGENAGRRHNLKLVVFHSFIFYLPHMQSTYNWT